MKWVGTCMWEGCNEKGVRRVKFRVGTATQGEIPGSLCAEHYKELLPPDRPLWSRHLPPDQCDHDWLGRNASCSKCGLTRPRVQR